MEGNPLSASDPSGLIPLGDKCNFNIFTGKLECSAGSASFGCSWKLGDPIPSCAAKIKNCTLTKDGMVCTYDKGPVKCKLEFNSNSGKWDYDIRPAGLADLNPAKRIKRYVELLGVATDVGGDAMQAAFTPAGNLAKPKQCDCGE